VCVRIGRRRSGGCRVSRTGVGCSVRGRRLGSRCSVHPVF